jgi:hypothetical protein
MGSLLVVVRQGSPASDSRLFSRLYTNSYEPFLLQLMAEQRPKLCCEGHKTHWGMATHGPWPVTAVRARFRRATNV